MADMCGDQHLLLSFSGQEQLSISQRSGLKIAVNIDAIKIVLHCQPKMVRQTEAPIAGEISRAVRYEIRLIRQGMHMPGQLLAADHVVDRTAVADDMKV